MKLALLFLLMAGLFTACSDESQVIIEEQTNIERPIGTNGQLISIQSDNVQAAGYDLESMVMTVQFDNGSVYEYYGVPLKLWDSFVAAQPHPWSKVGYPQLVQAGVPYKKIK